MLLDVLLLCPRCHSTRLVPLSYLQSARNARRYLREARPTEKCVTCGYRLRGRDVLVRMKPSADLGVNSRDLERVRELDLRN